jgi:hypothetical protein
MVQKPNHKPVTITMHFWGPIQFGNLAQSDYFGFGLNSSNHNLRESYYMQTFYDYMRALR